MSFNKVSLNFVFNFFRKYGTFSNNFTSRSHTCGELRSQHVGQKVSLAGWLEYQRMDRFAIIRDAYGSVQVIVPEERSDLVEKLKGVNLESVVAIKGEVLSRPQLQVNEKMATGHIEVIASDIDVLNNVSTVLPFTIRDHNKPKEMTRMSYRYLDIRFPQMQHNLRLRSKVIFSMREYLMKNGFIEVETPTLFKRTPGGAQEYVVPTEHVGDFYALVQSPQQLKQLLMVGGVDRYFQVARCYRNEGARPDRQPEFSQLDIEMSFTDESKIMEMVEELIHTCWPKEELGPLSSAQFKRMSYKEAMDSYGCDKPDLSSSITIESLNETVYLSPREHGSYTRFLNVPKATEWINSTIKKSFKKIKTDSFPKVKLSILNVSQEGNLWQTQLDKTKIDIDGQKFLEEHNLSEGDLLLLATSSDFEQATQLLGRLRTEIIFHENIIKKKRLEWNFVWVTDFPLFEKTDDGMLKSMHHPFTSPHPDDMNLIKSNPLAVRGLHYDLVLNGWEIAGGSVRIHDPKLQVDILTNFLNIPTESLQHLITALASGAPPHAGIAFGIDRFISLLVGAPSIRDVIAFPKTSEGRDMMCGAPCKITQEELDLYKINVKGNSLEEKIASKLIS